MESERLKFEKAGHLSVPRLPGQQVWLSLVIFFGVAFGSENREPARLFT